MRKLLASALVLCSLTVSAHDHYNGPIPEAALPDNSQGPLGHNVAVPPVAPPTTSMPCTASFAYPGSILGVATVDQDCVRRYTGATRAACMLPFGTFDFDCLERKRQKEELHALRMLDNALTVTVITEKKPGSVLRVAAFLTGVLVMVVIVLLIVMRNPIR